MKLVDVWVYPSPVSSIGRTACKVEVQPGDTFDKLLWRCGKDHMDPIIMADTKVVSKTDLVGDAQVVSVHARAEDPATISFLLLDAGIALGYEYVLGSIISSVLISVGTNYLIGAVFAPDLPTQVATPDVPNAYSVSASNNRVRAYQPMPVLLGTMRYSPDIDARPWTQFVDDPENVHDQTTVQTFTEQSCEAYYDNDANQWVNGRCPAFPSYSVTPEAWSLESAGVYITATNYFTTGNAVLTGVMRYRVSDGLYSFNNGAWNVLTAVHPTRTYTATVTGPSPETTQELTQVFNFGLGELTFSDFRFGQTHVSEFRGVTTSLATFSNNATTLGNDAAHPNPPYGGNTWKANVISVEGGELRQNANVANSGWVTRQFYGTDCEFIQVDIAGTLYYLGESGPTLTSCAFEIEYRVDGGAWGPAPGSPVTFQNADQFPVRETIGWAVPLGNSYDVRVRKTTTDSGDARLTQEFQFYQVKFFRPEPYDAANPFSNHPAQNRYAIAVRASGQINGTIDNLNALASAKCWVWSGSGTPTAPVGGAGWAWQTTENPAWWYLYYAMGGFRCSTDPRGWTVGPVAADGPRMFGAGLETSRIDLESIGAWAKFCVTSDLTFSAVVTDQTNVAEVLNRIARIGRGSSTWQNGKLGVVWEDPNAVPVAVFGMPSIRAGTFALSYVGENSPDEIVAAFTDPNDDWKENEVRKVVPGTVLPNSETRIQLWGCKRKSQAQREVNLLAARQFYQRRRVTFETDQEGLPVQRGDVILLTHDLTAWAYSGRVTDSVGNCTGIDQSGSIMLTRVFEPLNDATLHLQIVKPDGTIVSATTAMPSEPTWTLSGVAIDFGEFPDAVPEDWHVYAAPEPTPGKKMRVVGVEMADGRRVKMTCTDERAEMWAHESAEVPYVLGDSGEHLIAQTINPTLTKDMCSDAYELRWELINCRGAVVSVTRDGAEGSTNVLGDRLVLGPLASGTVVSVTLEPLLDVAAVKTVGSAQSFTIL